MYKNSVIEVEEFDFGVKALKPEKFKECQVQRLTGKAITRSETWIDPWKYTLQFSRYILQFGEIYLAY